MSNLQSDLDTVERAIAKALQFATNEPKDRNDYDAIVANNEAANAWMRSEGAAAVGAGFRVIAQFFRDINAIADGVNK
jgi:hypothetical protein